LVSDVVEIVEIFGGRGGWKCKMFIIHTVSECNWLPTLTINRAGRNNRTATFEISFEESTPINWNCEAMTPTKMVSKTAMDACSAPKKGISNS
jgi:hypothetical protein